MCQKFSSLVFNAPRAKTKTVLEMACKLDPKSSIIHSISYVWGILSLSTGQLQVNIWLGRWTRNMCTAASCFKLRQKWCFLALCLCHDTGKILIGRPHSEIYSIGSSFINNKQYVSLDISKQNVYKKCCGVIFNEP